MTVPPSTEQITVTIRVDVHDPAGFRLYASRVLELVERHGGRVVAAGPASAVEGELSTKATWGFVQHWPSRAHFDAFYTDPDYQPLKAERQNAASTQLLIIGQT